MREMKLSVQMHIFADMKNLLANISKLHTTPLGRESILRNLNLPDCDLVETLKRLIMNDSAKIERKGKNYYITSCYCKITVNACSFTIITAHLLKMPVVMLTLSAMGFLV